MKKYVIIIGLITVAFSTLILADQITTSTSNTTTTENTNGPGNTSTTTVTTTDTKVNDLDQQIVVNINSKLASDSALIGASISAASKDGIVTLSGSVTMQSQADEAISVTRSVPGVKEVISQINVKTNFNSPK